MGVDRKDYIMIGIPLPKEIFEEKNFDDKYLAYIEGRVEIQPFQLIMDVISGNYAIFGIVLQSCEEYEGVPFTRMKPDMLSKIEEVQNKAKELFNLDLKADLCVFTHWY